MRRPVLCVAAVWTLDLLGGAAQATTYVYDFPIDGSQEIPPVGTPGTGTGHVTYDDVTNELAWTISYGGLIGTPSAAHFHGPADYGETAGVQVNIATLSGGLTSPMIGSTTITETQEADLVAGLWYANIHSSFRPGGEIRGQVVPGAPGACCPPRVLPSQCESNSLTECRTLTQRECTLMGGLFLGPKSECGQQIREVIHTAAEWSHRIVTVSSCPDSDRGDENCIKGSTKIDAWTTLGSQPLGANCHDFAGRVIPAGFFRPGSDPFAGVVCFKGNPLGVVMLPGFPEVDFGDADTLVRRLADPFDRCELPSAEERTVDIVVVRLNLESCEPIVVTGGGSPESWDVRIEVNSSGLQPEGSTLTASKDHCNGGTFDSILTVCPGFVFTRVSPPPQISLTFDYCAIYPEGITMQAMDVDWVSDLGGHIGQASPICSDFHPGIQDDDPMTSCDCNGNGVRDQCDVEEGTSRDCSSNGLPDECETAAACPHADVNRDGLADGFDIAELRNPANWLRGTSDAANPCTDVNDDGTVDGFDIAVIRSGTCWQR